jgi:hypothetical protein
MLPGCRKNVARRMLILLARDNASWHTHAALVMGSNTDPCRTSELTK